MSEKHQVNKSISIKTTKEKAFNYINNPENTVEWLPSMHDIEKIQDNPPKWKFTYKLMGLSIKGEVNRLEATPNQTVVLESKSDFTNSTWYYSLEEKNNETVLDLKITYNLPQVLSNRFTDAILNRTNENEAGLAVDNLKTILESS